MSTRNVWIGLVASLLVVAAALALLYVLETQV